MEIWSTNQISERCVEMTLGNATRRTTADIGLLNRDSFRPASIRVCIRPSVF